MRQKFEYNMMKFRHIKNLSKDKINQILFQKIFLLTVGSLLAVAGLAAFWCTNSIEWLPLLLILWSLLLLFHDNLTQTGYQLGLAIMFMATIFAKSTDNIFFNEEIFGYLSKYLGIGSTINFFVMLFIFFNIIASAGNPELFGLFSPGIRQLLRYKKQRRNKIRRIVEK